MKKKRRGFFFDDDWFFEEFERIREEMERMMEHMFKEGFGEDFAKGNKKVYGVSIHIGPDGKPVIREFGNIKPEERKISEEMEPLVEVMKEGNEIVVTAEVPGVEKEDIKLSGSDDELEIKVDTAKRKYYKKIRLPAIVDHKKAKARYKNGILEVRLPIKEEKEKKDFIPVE